MAYIADIGTRYRRYLY